jgi:hypothetical protein
MLIFIVSIMGGMTITGMLYEGIVPKENESSGSRSGAIMSWALGAIATGGLCLLVGWLLDGFSDEYWRYLAREMFMWGVGMGALVGAGVISIIKGQRREDR